MSALVTVGALVLVWELRGSGSPAARRRAREGLGGALTAVAVYAALGSVRELAGAHDAGGSELGVVAAAGAAACLPVLARAKQRLAEETGNPALRADAALTRTLAVVALVVLAAVWLDAALGWWWADPLAGLALAVLLLRAGLVDLREASGS